MADSKDNKKQDDLSVHGALISIIFPICIRWYQWVIIFKSRLVYWGESKIQIFQLSVLLILLINLTPTSNKEN